jgi:hypothetical protein
MISKWVTEVSTTSTISFFKAKAIASESLFSRGDTTTGVVNACITDKDIVSKRRRKML